MVFMSFSKKYTNNNPDFDNKDFDFFEEYNKIKSKKKRISFCISYIQNKLSHQFVSAIVGAGFSKNASQEFPDWANLLVDAYVEMSNNPGKRDEGESFEDYKKNVASIIHRRGEPLVASEYERYKGIREALDLYIEERIAKVQKENLNLEVHQEFLNLNWCDVITTNWDCLLEKANERLNVYSLVKNAKDLRVTNKKRIIKIHGSIREKNSKDKYEFDGCFDHLYVITEKDYEKYHINHEGFSNFMKVKMLENSLCLFGFSGTDWNFRFWIKELKRMMSKGGETKNLNPIFLFDVSTEPHDLAEIQFFENNYIIPLKVDEVLNCIDCDLNVKQQGACQKFSHIFKFFAPPKEQLAPELDMCKKGSLLLKNFLNDTSEKAFEKLVDEYPKLPRFGLFNLSYTRVIIRKIQSSLSFVDKWTEKEYLFVYLWCTNNFLSLTHLFKRTQIESIVKRYIREKYYLKYASEFADIVFKYFVDNDDEAGIDSFALCVGRKNDDVVFYYKTQLYIKKLEFQKLNAALTKWTIGKEKEVCPRYLLGKINAMIAFENSRFASPCSEQIYELFEKALDVCGNENDFQLYVFVLLYYKSYLFKTGKKIPNNIQSELDTLRYKKCDYPYDFIEALRCEKKEEPVKPNSKRRIQNTKKISIDNFEELTTERILNFFEYTALPMNFFLSEQNFMLLIEENKAYPDFLVHLFPLAMPYYGRDSDEDFLRCVVPSILRNLDTVQTKCLFERTLQIFENKLRKKEDFRSLCYVMDEFIKRVEGPLQNEYYKIFWENFFCDNGQSSALKELVATGRIWGIYEPFIRVLLNITNEDTCKRILDWLIERKISEKLDAFSGYLSYYDAIISNEKMKSFLKEYFNSPQVMETFAKSMDRSLYLVLDAYALQPSKMKKMAKDYLANNMTLDINPYFVKVCYTPKLKSTLLELITRKNYNIDKSSEWPISEYIYVLCEIGKLNAKELDLICRLISKRILRQIDDARKGDDSLFDWNLERYFEVIKKATLDLHAEEKGSVRECLNLLEPIYKEKSDELLKCDWLNIENGQELRNKFYKAYSFAEFLHKEDRFVRCIRLMLAKIITRDDPIFEAVLQIFVNKCSTDVWRSRLTMDDEVKFYVACLVEKFQKDIPMCYDDLFIKEKISELKRIFGI